MKARKGSTRSLNELLKMDNIERGYKLTAQNTGVVEKRLLYLCTWLQLFKLDEAGLYYPHEICSGCIFYPHKSAVVAYFMRIA